MSRIHFSLRAILLLTFLVALFFAGYRQGYNAGYNGSWENVGGTGVMAGSAGGFVTTTEGCFSVGEEPLDESDNPFAVEAPLAAPDPFADADPFTDPDPFADRNPFDTVE